MTNIDGVSRKMQGFNPRKKWFRRWVKRSAVALILRQCDDRLDVLMIRRADRDGDPWSGHMAFPGGRADAADSDTLHTARRETWEEIGLDTRRCTRLLGRLSDVLARPRLGRSPMVITPYLFVLEEMASLQLNHEVAEVVWVPLNYFVHSDNRQQIVWPRGLWSVTLPSYNYQGRQIWGLSLAMLDELIAAII